jgi:hypothetical protein
MASSINASTSGAGGLVSTADASGVLTLQAGGNTVANFTNTGGTAPRITADFSNGTFSNRTAFQTTTTNGGTLFNIIPNGTSVSASYDAYNNSDMNNSLRARFGVNASEYYVNGNVQGTGSFLPFNIYTNNAAQMSVAVNGNLSFNSGYGSAAVAYGCRAWVNFNGTGTVAIRASGNVSSITDGGTGIYTVNFTTALPDANYETNGITSDDSSAAAFCYLSGTTGSASTSSVMVRVVNTAGTPVDRTTVAVSIHR